MLQWGRPDVGCAFDVMARCDRHMAHDPAAAEACREGARDAHLLSWREPSRDEWVAAAYDIGHDTTTVECTPLYEAPALAHWHQPC
jgi:hypothetical protein